jgi:CubicO group peptidase (beta-lactamase class C family)
MSSGLRFNESYGDVSDVTRMLYLEPDMAGFVRRQPLDHPPGNHFDYASGTTVLLSRIWQDAAGGQAAGLPAQRLFGPLGMRSAVLETDARGSFVGSSYLYATPQDWARFAQFLLQDGVWQGRRLLPPGFVATMFSAAPASAGQYSRGQMWLQGPEGPHADKDFDLPTDTVWLLGHDGQSIAIVPSRQLVLLRMGLTPARMGYQPQALLKDVLATLPAR